MGNLDTRGWVDTLGQILPMRHYALFRFSVEFNCEFTDSDANKAVRGGRNTRWSRPFARCSEHPGTVSAAATQRALLKEKCPIPMGAKSILPAWASHAF